jgi:hypothetical protein
VPKDIIKNMMPIGFFKTDWIYKRKSFLRNRRWSKD